MVLSDTTILQVDGDSLNSDEADSRTLVVIVGPNAINKKEIGYLLHLLK